jgi:hypothetical protein
MFITLVTKASVNIPIVIPINTIHFHQPNFAETHFDETHFAETRFAETHFDVILPDWKLQQNIQLLDKFVSCARCSLTLRCVIGRLLLTNGCRTVCHSLSSRKPPKK